jgi:hypothetical protein
MGAFEPSRNQEQRRSHIQVMLVSKFTRVRSHAVTARVTAQPKTLDSNLEARNAFGAGHSKGKKYVGIRDGP